jgi:hypothetical protein
MAIGGSPSRIRGVWTGSFEEKRIKLKLPSLWESAIIVTVFIVLTVLAVARAYTTSGCSTFCAKIPERAYSERCRHPTAAEECTRRVPVRVVVHPRGCEEGGDTSFKFIRMEVLLATSYEEASKATGAVTMSYGLAASTLGNINTLDERAAQDSEVYPTPIPSAVAPQLISTTTVPVTTTVTLLEDVPWTPFPSIASSTSFASTPYPTASSCTDASTFHCRCLFYASTPLPHIQRSLINRSNLASRKKEPVPMNRSETVPCGQTSTVMAITIVVVAVLECAGFAVGWFVWKQWSARKEKQTEEEARGV